MTVAGRITPDLKHIHVPDELRDLKGWLVWKFVQKPGEDKPRKVPHYTNGERRQGKAGSENDRLFLTDFEGARQVAVRKGYDGVGLALMPEFGIVALDFDDCVTNNEPHPDLNDLLSTTYAEISPSGKGLRAFFRCEPGQFSNRKSHKREGFEFGFEVFCTRGFVTFTGNVLPQVELLGNENTIAPVAPQVTQLYEQRFKRQLEAAKAGSGTPVGLTLAQIKSCLEYISPSCSYDQWLQVGMILHLETSASDDGLDIWDEWSSRGDGYPGRDELDYKWRTFGRGGGEVVTGATLVRMANDGGASINLNGPASAEEFEALVDDVQELEATGTPPRFVFEPVHQFSSTTALPWVIKGVLPRAGLGVVYGASGSGKSFAVLDMGMTIARGAEWRGRKVKQGRVAYIAAEGADGFRKRLAAYAQHNGVDLATVPMTVLNAAPNLLEKQDAVDVAKGIRASGGADLIIVDTFAQTTPGANENAGEDVGKALGYCKRIHEVTGAMVLLIHHSGKDATKGARGWSGLRAAADAEIEVVRTDQGRALRLTKSKDGEDGLEWGFDLEVVQLGVDEDLDPITSCVVIEASVPVGGVPTRKLGPVEKVVNDVIQEIALAQTSGIEVGPVLAEAVKRMEPPADGKRDSRKQRARRALEALCAGDDAPYWIADDGCITLC